MSAAFQHVGTPASLAPMTEAEQPAFLALYAELRGLHTIPFARVIENPVMRGCFRNLLAARARDRRAAPPPALELTP